MSVCACVYVFICEHARACDAYMCIQESRALLQSQAAMQQQQLKAFDYKLESAEKQTILLQQQAEAAAAREIKANITCKEMLEKV